MKDEKDIKKIQSELLMKAQLLSDLAHEIRTPMHSILGFAELLNEKVTDPEQKEFVERIQNASKHLLYIVNDYLDYSKLEANKMTILHEPFDLDVLLAEVKALFIESLKHKKLYFDIELIDCPSHLIGDPNRIKQILINLLSNAIKFTTTGGISLVIFPIKQEDLNIRLGFKVKDTGHGMTHEQVSKVFDAYEQFDQGTFKQKTGTGLGLHISKQLAKLMHGDIHVESVLYEGTEFILELPLKVDSHKEGLTEDPPVVKFIENAKILVAEDHFISQKLMQRMLTDLKLEPTLVNHGEDVINYAKKEYFDLILLDIEMPILNGFDTAKALRKLHIKTPIVAMTGHPYEFYEKEKWRDINGYLMKPIDAKALYQILTQYISVKKDA
ncbi:MAG: hypothetical protein CVV61_06450 [Tenericutes bacterium HGW-Tenericutes-6]|jgi:CheY-like chemotaxis protein/two-component sensor histidine kinase|nr:MAG: hypothetical protein CVV61_06450 [Tenericutes bacterium HGW-Tenericutes-6]